MSTFALMMAVLAALASLGVALTAWLATLSVGDEPLSFAGFKVVLLDDSAAADQRRTQPGYSPSSQLFAGRP